jgi:hypothetical protein
MAPIAPALTRTEETVSHPAAVKPESAPPVQKAAAVPSQPIKELIVKGPSRVEPPRVVRPERASSATGLWIGLGCVALAACIAAPILMKRQRKPSGPSRSGKAELVMPTEFLLKEPESLPCQTIAFDRMYPAKETSKQQIL